LGDRLVYSNGIILLSLFAAALVIIFRGDTNAIIPLYAVGVFTSFTLSQAGMVRHWYEERTSGWRPSAIMNSIGAIATLIVLCVIVITKFLGGAWVVVVAIPLLVSFFLAIQRHYQYVAKRLTLEDVAPRNPGVLSTVIIPAFVTRNWWEGLLHNQTSLFLKAALRAKKSRVITTVRYYL
jgi:hypothetical protein